MDHVELRKIEITPELESICESFETEPYEVVLISTGRTIFGPADYWDAEEAGRDYDAIMDVLVANIMEGIEESEKYAEEWVRPTAIVRDGFLDAAVCELKNRLV